MIPSTLADTLFAQCPRVSTLTHESG